jgi:hypothetical protein
MDEIINFENQKIRRIWHNEEWYFSVVDIIRVLTESSDARNYWKVLKNREIQVVTICNQLKLKASDGKMRATDCVTRKGILRLVQSIPSKKAQPFKEWLAQIGEDRLQEIENPELAQQRVKEYYEIKGYSKGWIEKRLRGIAVREELTDEWKNRGVEESSEFAILTNEISKATFDKSVKEYKDFKGLIKKNQNLRDNMTDLELIFSMLGEASTTAFTREENSQGFDENLDSAKKGGDVAKTARLKLELGLKKSVISSDNYLELDKKKKLT